MFCLQMNKTRLIIFSVGYILRGTEGRPLSRCIMIQITEGRICEICEKNEAVVFCNGCGKVLCTECRIFDIWYCGCGHANSMAFCKKCDADPAINTWKTSE